MDRLTTVSTKLSDEQIEALEQLRAAYGITADKDWKSDVLRMALATAAAINDVQWPDIPDVRRGRGGDRSKR